jgi:2-C-methyl-D-erythritol 4-phosphate cytidylyltransferase
MRVFCGILASGIGERYSKKSTPKQLMPLGGSTLFTTTLKNAKESEIFHGIIISVLEKQSACFIKSIENELGFDTKNDIFVTPGGKTRMNSILRIIEKFKELYIIKDDDILCLVDANRPLIDKDIYNSVIKGAATHSISCPSKGLVDGVGFVEGGFLTAVLDKARLQTIQTPEACNFKKLINLIEGGKHHEKSGLCEIFLGVGIRPKVVESSYKTYKVTYPGDMLVIEAFMQRENEV